MSAAEMRHGGVILGDDGEAGCGRLLVGEKVRLRALEQEDVETLYRWENDTRVWSVSGTLAPWSRAVLREFIENQKYDIYRTRQMRLVIARVGDDVPVGCVDLFDFDPVNLRAGVGIVICDEEDRRKGYASEAIGLLCEYADEILGLHQLYCSVGAGNRASIELFCGRNFVKTGLKREWSRSGGIWEDEIFFQRIFLSR